MYIIGIRNCDPQCDRFGLVLTKTSSLLLLVYLKASHIIWTIIFIIITIAKIIDAENLSYSLLTPHQIMGGAHKLSRVLQPIMMMMMMMMMIRS